MSKRKEATIEEPAPPAIEGMEPHVMEQTQPTEQPNYQWETVQVSTPSDAGENSPALKPNRHIKVAQAHLSKQLGTLILKRDDLNIQIQSLIKALEALG